MSHKSGHSDVAVIGMSCRVAGANSPAELWDLLASSRDVLSEITRFNMDGYYHPAGGPRKGLTNVRSAHMMEDDAISRFDNAFFHTTPIEAIAIDPQQRMLLEVTYEAVENAGIPLESFVGTDTAVFAGMDSCDYHSVIARDIDDTPKYLATGTATCMAANRLSYFYDLSGPSLAVDTACSSTMAALHQATRVLQRNDAGMAIVCGAKLILSPDMFVPSSELGFLSPSGRCRSFDAAGDGYGRGEGVLALLLKPLNKAVHDRDPIRAVLRGTRLNQDGRTQGITLPSSKSQRDNIERLYHQLDLSPDDVQYVEAHGTGTAAGDPLEFCAINNAFNCSQRDEPLVVGSLKSNIGHLEACAALAGIIKTIECLERGKIPPQSHFIHPNPNINFENVKIPIELTNWPPARDGVRRAAVNTFGAGGTNGHAVLEEYHRVLCCSPPPIRPLLFKVSAANNFSLRRLMAAYANHIERSCPSLQDLAYTLLSRRSGLRDSVFFTASTHEEVIRKLRAEDLGICTNDKQPDGKVVFLFTGQGAQWPKMAQVLVEQSPIFKAVLLECEQVLAKVPENPSWSIIEELSKNAESSNVYQAEYSQPLCTAIQLGLVVLWKSWGLTPNAVVGHSSGEIAAAYAAGFISLQDAIIVAYYRGYFTAKLAKSKPKGCMCAVGLDQGRAQALLESFEGRVQLAAINSPTSCTFSGDQNAIKEILRMCKQTDTFCRELRVDMGKIAHHFVLPKKTLTDILPAYHSKHMLPVATSYEKALKDVVESRLESSTNCDMFSSVSGRKLDLEECLPAYWIQNMVSTVQFTKALTECLNSNPDTFMVLEVGPHPALKGPVQESLQNMGKESINYYHSCMREKNDMETLLESAGSMIAHGISLRTSQINARMTMSDVYQSAYEFGNTLTNLPSYQWDHTNSFWTESNVSRKIRQRQFPRHQLLGSRYVEDLPSCPNWRCLLMLKEVPWLMELKTRGARSTPPVVYILMALEAARQLHILANNNVPTTLLLSKLVFDNPLPLAEFGNPDTVVELHLNARQSQEVARYEFEIFSTAAGESRHCSGRLGWTENSIQEPDLVELDITMPNRGKLISEKILAVEQDTLLPIQALQISCEGASGEFESSKNYYEHYCIDPIALMSILDLPPLSLIGENLTAVYKMSFIESVSVPAGVDHIGSGCFAIQQQSRHLLGGRSNIEICLDESHMLISDLRFEVDHLVEHKPKLGSLYYKPAMLPDVTKLSACKAMSLSYCLELLAHKWPMSDIGMIGINRDLANSILKILCGAMLKDRPRCRSIQILGEEQKSTTERIKFLEDFEVDTKFHMLFMAGDFNAERIHRRLQNHGLVCVQDLDMTEETKLSEFSSRICRLTGIDQHNWTLWRVNENPIQQHFAPNPIIFACPEQGISHIDCLPNAEYISLQPGSMVDFCRHSNEQKYDVVVADCPKSSIITTWAGNELVPWLQNLLKSANSILWVTQEASQSPFNNVAGTLLRTLQSEQPALKVTWLVFRDAEKESFFQATIASAYTALLNGENEVRMEVRNSEVHILRYLPDDDLSAILGIIPPRMVNQPIDNKEYQLTLSAARKPVILSANPEIIRAVGYGKIEVVVESSVVDINDVAAYNGIHRNAKVAGLGRFFAGRVSSAFDSTLPAGSQVVGWQPRAHHKRLEVSPEHLHLYNAERPSASAAANFAVTATALCIVDGFARARDGDTFSLQVPEILKQAIAKYCIRSRATVLDAQNSISATFTVSFNVFDGLLVNGSSIDIDQYLGTRFGTESVSQAWKREEEADYPLKVFCLPKYREAFQAAENNAYSTVLSHSDKDKPTKNVLVHKQIKRIFSGDGAYIIVGGLGGLGRFVCSWMVDHGAKRLVAISRSGLQSDEARETFTHINTSGASMGVMKVDACDRHAMSKALSQVRQSCPIKGVINMAMILGDAPLVDMTGEQWDRALRLKVDSSWNLHEETLQDPLEFFIMFSSVASVLGNRNQAGYNIGNTFLNALATYRRSLGLTAISIALGAMTDMGVLYDLGRKDLLQTLMRSGLSPLRKLDLEKIMEAAVIESHHSTRSIIVTGLEMFERIDGKLVGTQDQTQLYWTEVPEFGFLQEHRLSDAKGRADTELNLREQIQKLDEKKGHAALLDAFIAFISQLLGFSVSTFNSVSSLATYGLDSLSAVSCQYWFHREVSIDVSVADVLNAPSINRLITQAYTKCLA